MYAFTSGLAIASALGYMNSGRDSGAYSPDWIVSLLGATQPLPSSTETRFSVSWFCA